MSAGITAVGVVVPAHDEQDRITACMTSVRDALARAPGPERVLCVVLDRCRDATAARAAAVRAAPGVAVELLVADRPGGVGGVRDAGVRHVLGRLGGHPPERTWLLHTDADTTVGPDWVRSHLAHAARGAHGVAGLADLDSAILPPAARRAYAAVLADGERPGGHAHVYGANLGVRADAYLAVGGFPAAGPGEDHGLWGRLAAAGRPLVTPTDLRVRTSARTTGRAAGGLADLLAAL